MRTLTILLTCIVLSACSVNNFPGLYRVAIPQGNLVAADQLNEIELGMNKRQVSFLLGTPSIVDVFHPEQWDYYFHMRPSRGENSYHRVTLIFAEDTLKEIRGNGADEEFLAKIKPQLKLKK